MRVPISSIRYPSYYISFPLPEGVDWTAEASAKAIVVQLKNRYEHEPITLFIELLVAAGYEADSSLSSAVELVFVLDNVPEAAMLAVVMSQPYSTGLCQYIRVTARQEGGYAPCHVAGSYGEPVEMWRVILNRGRLFAVDVIADDDLRVWPSQSKYRSLPSIRELRKAWGKLSVPQVVLFGYAREESLLLLTQSHRDLGAALQLCGTEYLAQAGYLLQQSIEKSLKALLFHCGRAPRRIHPLENLVDEVSLAYPSIGTRLSSRYRRLMQKVTPFAVLYRYQSLDPTFGPDHLWEYVDLAVTAQDATWRVLKSHACAHAVATALSVGEWNEQSVTALAARFARAIRWSAPTHSSDCVLLDWLKRYKHLGRQPGLECGCQTTPRWRPIAVSRAWWEAAAEWWLLLDDQVLCIEADDKGAPPACHYLIRPSA